MTRAALPASVTELVPDKLYAVGGSIPGTPHPCWMPVDSDGWIPLQCYVFRSGGTGIIVDTGTGIHRKQITAGLEALLSRTSRRELLMTRREPECSVNLDWIVRDFNISVVRCAGEYFNPLDFFASFENANTQALVNASTGDTFKFMAAGDVLEIGAFEMHILRTPIRVLSTSWFYESVTRTLFSTDFWGFATQRDPESPPVVRSQSITLSPEVIRDFTGTKFDFLWATVTSSIFRALKLITDQYPIDRVCPSYGCVLEGRDLVADLVEKTRIAMEQLARAPHRSELDGVELATLAVD